MDENDDGLLTGAEVLRFIKGMVGVASKQDASGAVRGVGGVSDKSWAVMVLRMAAADDKWAQGSTVHHKSTSAGGLTLTFAQFVDATVLLVNRQFGVLVAPQDVPDRQPTSNDGGERSVSAKRHIDRTAARHALWREELFLMDVVADFISGLTQRSQPLTPAVAGSSLIHASTRSHAGPPPGQAQLAKALAGSEAATDLASQPPPALAQALLDAEVDAVLSGVDPEQARRAVLQSQSQAPAALPVLPNFEDDAASVGSFSASVASTAHSYQPAGRYHSRFGTSPNGPRGRPRRISRAGSPLRSARSSPLQAVSSLWLLPDGWVTLLRRMGVSQRNISRVDCLRIFDWAYRTQCAADAAQGEGTAPVHHSPLGMGIRFGFFAGALAAVAVHLKGRHPFVLGSLPRAQCISLLLATLHVPPPSTGTELEHLVPVGTNAHALFPAAMHAIHWLSGLLPPLSPYTEAAAHQPVTVRHLAQHDSKQHATLVQHLAAKLRLPGSAAGQPPVLAQAALWSSVCTAVGVPLTATARPSAGPGGTPVGARLRRAAALAAALSPFSARRDRTVQTPAQVFLGARLRDRAGLQSNPLETTEGIQGHAQSESRQKDSPARYPLDLSAV